MGKDNRIIAAAGRGVAALLLCALLAGMWPFAALAEDGDEGGVVHRAGDVVYTAQGWEEWLAEYEFQKPGTMVLGANITLGPEHSRGINGRFDDTDIVVQTGDYGITLQSNFYLGSQVQITGTGQLVPVITMENGTLILGGYDATSGVTATGDGGCAIDVKAGGSLFTYLGNFTAITADGQNATALRVDGNLAINGLIVRAPGEGSVAIRCTGDVDLSHSLAVGGLASVQAQSVVADISTLRPLPENGDITKRTITSVKDDFYQSAVGEPLSSYLDTPSRYTCTLAGTRTTPSGSEAAEPEHIIAWFGHHPDDVAAIDTSTPGLYPVRLVPADTYGLLDLMPGEPLLTYYRVYTYSDLPTYKALEFNMGYLIAVYSFYSDPALMYTLEDEFTLWRRDGDDGEWYVDTSYLAMEFNGDELAVVFDAADLSPVTQLVLEREGCGQTKILRITFDGDTPIGTTGGDKDGGDAGGEEPPGIDQPAPSGSSISSNSSSSPSSSSGSSSSSQPGHSGSTSSSSGPAGSSSQPGSSGNTASASGSGGGSSPGNTSGPTDSGNTGNTGGGVVPDGVSRDVRHAGTILPTALQTGGEAPAPVTERVTATETTVGGRRLADMMAIQGESVLFQKDSISLAVPSTLLAALNVGENDALTVRLEALDGGMWRVDVAVNGQSLESLPGCWVTVAYPLPEGAEGLAVHGPDGREVPGVEYDAEAGTVRFLAQAPGVYTMNALATPLAQPVGGTAATTDAPKDNGLAAGLLAGAAVCFLAAGGLVFVLHRRRSHA